MTLPARSADIPAATKIKDVNYIEIANALTKRNQDKERRKRIGKITDPSELAQEIIAYQLDLTRQTGRMDEEDVTGGGQAGLGASWLEASRNLRAGDDLGADKPRRRSMPREIGQSHYEMSRQRRIAQGHAATIIMESIKDDPDKVAQVLNTSKVFSALSGIVPPFEVMKQFQSEFEKEIRLRKNEKILRETPLLALWMRKPEFASLAKDDVKNLSWWTGIRITGSILVLVMVIACFLVALWAVQWIRTKWGNRGSNANMTAGKFVNLWISKAKRIAGGGVKTNDAVYVGLVRMSRDDPDGFAQINPLDYRDQLSDSDWKQVMGWWRATKDKTGE